MNDILWIPARTDDEAPRVGNAIANGIVPCLGQYQDEERAKAAAASNAALYGEPAYIARRIVIEARATDDGYIPVARLADKVGEIAAVLFLIVGGAYAVGLATLI